jgi:predicted Zn-dependent protease
VISVLTARVLAIVVAAVVAAPSAAHQQPDAGADPVSTLSPAATARFTEGVSALKANRLDDAERAFREVLRTGSDLSFVHHNLGLVLQERRRFADALTEFQTAIRLDPSYGPSHLMAGTALLALKRPREALVPLHKAGRVMPSDLAVSARLAEAYEQVGDMPRLTDELRRLHSLTPQDPEYAYRLGQGYLALAEWSIERLRAVDSTSPRLQQMRAQTYIRQGRTQDAVRALESAAAADPRLPEVHLVLADLYLRERQLDRAAAAVAAELATQPQSSAALALRARIDEARTR